MKQVRYISILLVLIFSSNILAQPTQDVSLENVEQESFDNYIYLEVWGHSWFSLNYFRFFQSPNILIGGGFGGNLNARNFTLDEGGGEIIQLFFEKQFTISNKFQSGLGIGVTHDFA